MHAAICLTVSVIWQTPGKDADVRALLESLKDSNHRLAAMRRLAELGSKAEPAVPELVRILTQPSERRDDRIEAATTLSRIGAVKAAADAVPALLKTLEDTKEDSRVRERVLWTLRVHTRKLADFPGAMPAIIRVMAGATTPDNKMLRYDSAYLVGMLQGPEAPARTIDILFEFLKDEAVPVYIAAPKEEKGDGRLLAVQALKRIGPAVAKRADVVKQLQALADASTWQRL